MEILGGVFMLCSRSFRILSFMPLCCIALSFRRRLSSDVDFGESGLLESFQNLAHPMFIRHPEIGCAVLHAEAPALVLANGVVGKQADAFHMDVLPEIPDDLVYLGIGAVDAIDHRDTDVEG